jgi:hypothetical protein
MATKSPLSSEAGIIGQPALEPTLISSPELDAAEPPTGYAELEIKLGPTQSWGTASGKVPPEQAHHLITTFGIVASVIAGITGTVLTLRIAAGLNGPAYAVIGLAFAAIVLIAARRELSRPGWHRDPPEMRARGRPGKRLQGSPDPRAPAGHMTERHNWLRTP